MADQTESSIQINAAPAQVMAVIADLNAYPQWSDGITEVKILSIYDEDGRPADARFHLSSGAIKDTYELEYDWDGDRRVSWTLTKGDMLTAMDGSYELTGNPDGSTAVDYTVNAAVGFPFVTGPEAYDGPVNHVLPAWDALAPYLEYVSGGFDDPATYTRLRDALASVDARHGTEGNRLFYLAVPPDEFPAILGGLVVQIGDRLVDGSTRAKSPADTSLRFIMIRLAMPPGAYMTITIKNSPRYSSQALVSSDSSTRATTISTAPRMGPKKKVAPPRNTNSR